MTLERAITGYKAKTPRSRQLFEEALRVMPGGNSRTTTFFDPYPFYITRGEGARIWDADGVERLDFNCNYTSLILGHANRQVVKTIQEAAGHGMSFPGPSEHEIRLAELLTTRIPAMEVVRFANSGRVCASRGAWRSAPRRGAASAAQAGLSGPDHRRGLALLAAPHQEEAQRLSFGEAGRPPGAGADVPGPDQRGRAPVPARPR